MFGWFRKKQKQEDGAGDLVSSSAAQVLQPSPGMPPGVQPGPPAMAPLPPGMPPGVQPGPPAMAPLPPGMPPGVQPGPPAMAPQGVPTLANQEAPKGPKALLGQFNSEFTTIKNELEGLLSEASEGSEGIIATLDVGDRRLGNAWNAVHTRHRDLLKRFEISWSRISRKLENMLSEQKWQEELLKRNFAESELDLLFLSARCQVMARAGELERQKAQASTPATRACQFCGGQLPPVHAVSMSVNLPCGFCNAVNTIDPGIAWRMFAGEGAVALSELVALPRWVEMSQLRVRLEWYENDDEVPLQLLENYYQASLTYWTAYETHLAQLVPESQDNLERVLSTRKSTIERELKSYPKWKSRVR